MNSDWMLIGFVGTTKYYEGRYFFGQKNREGRFGSLIFGEFLFEEWGEGSVVLAFTPESYDMHFQTLKEIFDPLPGLRFDWLVYTPDDLPKLFEDIFRILEKQGPKRLFFDITFAYRSVPFCIFPEIVFVKRHLPSISDLEVFYARQLEPSGDPRMNSYRFEALTSPIEILDWDNATREFLDHGNGRFFAEKLMANYQTVMAQVPDKEKRKYSPWKLVANKFGEFSQAFEEGDFVGVGLVANALEKMLQGESFQASLGALNFGWVTRALVEQILPSLQKVAIDARRKEEVPLDRKELARQLQLLRWYQEIQNIPNMLQGLREFMVNLVLFQNQEGNWLDLETRGKAEEKWNGHLKESEEKRIPLPDNSSLRLWDLARSLRNFISHCGLKKENRPGVDLSFLHSFLDREIDAWLNGAAHPFESWEEV